jgi:hypothetical protein
MFIKTGAEGSDGDSIVSGKVMGLVGMAPGIVIKSGVIDPGG